MKVKFLRNVAVYSEHREQGSIHEIADKDAMLLISDRAAVPVRNTPETAAAPPAAESAAMPAPDHKKHRKA